MADDGLPPIERAPAETGGNGAASPAEVSGSGDNDATQMKRLDFLPLLLAAHRVLRNRLGASEAQARLQEHLGLRSPEAARTQVARAGKALNREVASLGSLGFVPRSMLDYWATAFERLSDDDLLTWLPTKARPSPFSALDAAELFEAVNRGGSHPCPR